MPEWSGLFDRHMERTLAGVDGDAFRRRFAWVDDLSAKAVAALDPETLAASPPADIYAALDALNVPGCAVRMTNLGRMNQAPEIVEAIIRLLAHPGDFAEKYRAGKIPQAGVVAMTEILSLARPDRFVIRNAPFTRALAKQVPFYTQKALDELGYEEFLDICRELTRVLVARLKPLGLAEWAGEKRFLLLYAVLSPQR